MLITVENMTDNHVFSILTDSNIIDCISILYKIKKLTCLNIFKPPTLCEFNHPRPVLYSEMGSCYHINLEHYDTSRRVI